MADAVSGLYSPTLAWLSAKFDINGTGVKAYFVAPFKCQVKRVAFVALDGETDSGGATMSFDTVHESTITTGSATAGAGILTIPSANNDSHYIYRDLAFRAVLNPGDQVNVNVSAEGVTGLNGVAVILYQEIPEVLGNVSDAVATA